MRFSPFWQKLKATAHTLPYDSRWGTPSLASRCCRGDAAWVTAPTLVIAMPRAQAQLREAAIAAAAVLPNARHRELKVRATISSMKVLAPVLVDFFGGRILGGRGRTGLSGSAPRA